MTAKIDGLVKGDDGKLRCWWCDGSPEYIRYHDEEWGRPVTQDHLLFEKICLEGFQAGLSWLTILRKRERFRAVFAGFDPIRVAGFTASDVKRLLDDPGIVRHRGKIESTINNARRALELIEERGSLAAFVWSYRVQPASSDRLTKNVLMTRATTAQSITLSKDLKKRGWSFVGPTTIYAFMQAMGLVNDHLHGCHVQPIVTSLPPPKWNDGSPGHR